MPTADKPRSKARERAVRYAVVLWGSMTLGGVGIVSAFVIWHLSRRGRLLRDRLGPPRETGLSADDPPR